MPRIWWERTTPKGKYHAFTVRSEDQVSNQSYCGCARSQEWQAGTDYPPDPLKCTTCAKNLRRSRRLLDDILSQAEKRVSRGMV